MELKTSKLWHFSPFWFRPRLFWFTTVGFHLFWLNVAFFWVFPTPALEDRFPLCKGVWIFKKLTTQEGNLCQPLQAAITNNHRLGSLNKTRSGGRDIQDQGVNRSGVWEEPASWLAAFSMGPHVAKKEKRSKLSPGSSRRAPPHDIKTSQSHHPQIPSFWG